MEIERNSDLVTPDNARAAIGAAGRAERSMHQPPLPRWFFPAMALVVMVLLLVQMLDAAQRSTATLGVAVVALLLNGLAQRSTGVAWSSHRLRGQLPFLLAMAVVIGGTAVGVVVTERDWVWAVGAVMAAVVVLITGLIYTRTAGDRP